MPRKLLVKRIEELQETCIALATGKETRYETYEKARLGVLEEGAPASQLPEWLRKCRYGSQFWSFIKGEFKTYQERRDFLWGDFERLLNYAERAGIGPTVTIAEEYFQDWTSEGVKDAWHRCFQRRDTDPKGAITSARTLLESTCKYILHERSVEFDDTTELPKLYKLVAANLKLSPDQYQEQIFKQILSGCGSVVDGLGALRNKLGDAHGRRVGAVRPTKRHAELAVNLAGTISSFLIATLEERRQPLPERASEVRIEGHGG